MIKTYTYPHTSHAKLHEFIMAFFKRIEHETGDIEESFFEKEFYDNLVKRQKSFFLNPLKEIYSITKTWSQTKRSKLYNQIKESNEIEAICKGTKTAFKISDIDVEIRTKIESFFSRLYEGVLKGTIFQETYGSRRDNYHEFKRYKRNNRIDLCPACGLVEMKNCEERLTNQYDHYLPKDHYPFSVVNFKNLVPVCDDCNGFQVKSNNDILEHTGKVFYPYDESHKPIEVDLEVVNDNGDDLTKIEWQISYSCEKGKEDELKAWKKIYYIEERYTDHIKGNIKNWCNYFEAMLNHAKKKEKFPNVAERIEDCLISYELRKELEYKTIKTIYHESKAAETARAYSKYAS